MEIGIVKSVFLTIREMLETVKFLQPCLYHK